MSRYSSTRRSQTRMRPFIAVLLISCFGILFAGCNGPEAADPSEEFVFTEDDVARFRELSDDTESGSGTTDADEPYLEALPSGSGSSKDGDIVLDLSLSPTYGSIRTGVTTGGANTYRVTNDFLNVRAAPSLSSENLGRLERGDTVEVLEFTDATWAKAKLRDGRDGYVAIRYIGKVTSDEKLEQEKQAFEGQYYVHFGFVNMRKEANQQSEKLGEIPGQTIVRPVSIENGWAKVSYDGKDGYVSESYLTEFSPTLLVRQDRYELPIMHYRIGQDTTLLKSLTDQVGALRQDGMTPITLLTFRELLLAQEQRDVRLDPNRFVVAVSGITPENVKDISDTLSAAGIPATFFIETRHIGLTGITEKSLLTLMANGFDIQSATHSGEDLRALTNSQVELELRQSRKILEDYTHKAVFAVAYPQGGVNDRVMQLAGDAGYLFGLSGNAERSFTRDQLLRMPSIVVFATSSLEEVVSQVKGE